MSLLVVYFFYLFVPDPTDSPLPLELFWQRSQQLPLALPKTAYFALFLVVHAACPTRKRKSRKLHEAHCALLLVKGALRHFLAVGQCFCRDILNSLAEMSEIRTDPLRIIHIKCV